VVRDHQPDAREGQAGRCGESERFIVPMKPGNAGGGMGPQFKTNATRSEGPGDWVTYRLRMVFRNCRRRCTRAYLGYRPSRKSIKRMVENIHELTARSGQIPEDRRGLG
jgi:hypothetical protein